MSHSEQGDAPLNQNQKHVQDYLDSLLREPDLDAFLAHDLGLEAGEKLDAGLPGDDLPVGQNKSAEPARVIEFAQNMPEVRSDAEVVEAHSELEVVEAHCDAEVVEDHSELEVVEDHSDVEVVEAHSELEVIEAHCDAEEVVAAHSELKVVEDHSEAEVVEDHSDVEVVEDHSDVEVVEAHCDAEVVEDHSDAEVVAAHSELEVVEDHSEAEVVEDHSEAEVVEDHCDAEVVEAHCDAEGVEAHSELEIVEAHCDAEVVEAHCDAEVVEAHCDAEGVEAHCDAEVVAAHSELEAVEAHSELEVIEAHSDLEIVEDHSDVEVVAAHSELEVVEDHSEAEVVADHSGVKSAEDVDVVANTSVPESVSVVESVPSDRLDDEKMPLPDAVGGIESHTDDEQQGVEIESAEVEGEAFVDTDAFAPGAELSEIDSEGDVTVAVSDQFDCDSSDSILESAKSVEQNQDGEASELDIENIAQALEEVVVEKEEVGSVPASGAASLVGDQSLTEQELCSLALHEERSEPDNAPVMEQDQTASVDYGESVPDDAQIDIPSDARELDGSLSDTQVSDAAVESLPNELSVVGESGPVIDTEVEVAVVDEVKSEHYESENVDAASPEAELSGVEEASTSETISVQDSVSAVANEAPVDPSASVSATGIEESSTSAEPVVNTRAQPPGATVSLPVGAAPSWVGVELNCVVVLVSGISIAIPMDHIESATSMEDISLSMDLAHDWILGQILRGDHTITYVLDSGSWMMPELYDPAKAKYKDLIMLQGGYWGIACDEMVRSVRIPVDKVSWAVNRTKRPWLLGTYMAERCAILDTDALVDQLNAAF